MKKILFFLFVLTFPKIVFAELITDLEVTNGTLSIPFTSNNNLYSVELNTLGEDIQFHYTLKDPSSRVLLSKEENKTTIHVTDSKGQEENYVFYIQDKEESTPVFKEYVEEETQKEIPHLKAYVFLGCLLIIILLFKFIVL